MLTLSAMLYMCYTGNLLVEADNVATAAAEAAARDAHFPEASSLEQAAQAAYKDSIRIRPIDIIRVPKYERVWQIGAMGQVCSLII